MQINGNQYTGYLARLLLWAIVSIVGIWVPYLIALWYVVFYSVGDDRMGCVVCAALPFVIYGAFESNTTLRKLLKELKAEEGRYRWEIAFAGIVLASPTFLGIVFIGFNILSLLLRS